MALSARPGCRRRPTETVAILIAAFCLLLTGCEKSTKVLTILGPPLCISPEVVSAFEQSEKCQVRFVPALTVDDLMTTVREERIDVDLIIGHADGIAQLQREGLLKELRVTKLPNRRFIDPYLLANSGFLNLWRFAVPLYVDPIGLAAPEAESGRLDNLSWRSLDETRVDGSKVAKSTILLNDKRAAISAALLALDLPANATDATSLLRAEQKLSEWCQAGLTFRGRSHPYHLLTNKVLLSQSLFSDIRPLEPDWRFLLPQSGFAVSVDCMAVFEGTQHSILAHRFINYVCGVNPSAQNMRWSLSLSPNKDAFALALTDVSHPALSFCNPNWSSAAVLLRPLAPEEEKRYADIWLKFRKFCVD